MRRRRPKAEAVPALHWPGVECRVFERYTCELPAQCQPAGGAGPKEARWSATILDISRGGVRVILPRRFEPGATLAIQLSADGGRQSQMALARVIHVLPRHVDGSWILGCEFHHPLTTEELEALVPSVAGRRCSSGSPAGNDSAPRA